MKASLNIDLIYLILNIILLLTFINSGFRIKWKNNYYKNIIIPVIAYTFILGARYKRGNDYMHYVDVYNHGFQDNHYTPIFTLFNDFLSGIGVNAYGAYFFYSAVFIICSVIFLSRYARYSKYILPTFLIAMLFFNEYQIRQSFGFGFVFLFLYSLFDITYKSLSDLFDNNNIRKYVVCIIVFFIIWGIHKANIFLVSVFVLSFFFIRRHIPIMVSIPMLVLSAYVIPNIFDFSILNPILILMAGDDEVLQTYVDNSHRWFSSSGYDDFYTRNTIVQLFEIFGHASLFYLGAKALKFYKKQQEAITIYNVYVFGTLFMISFRKLELMNRMGADLEHFWFFPISLVLFYRKKVLHKTTLKFISIFLVFFLYEYFKYLFFPLPTKTSFLWDAMN